LLDDVLGMAEGASGGIFGDDDGIVMEDVEGTVDITNDNGAIVGVAGNGIHLDGVDGAVTVSNLGGIISGGDEGIDLEDIDDDVIILNNGEGSQIIGGDDGIEITDVWSGDIRIENDGGLIE